MILENPQIFWEKPYRNHITDDGQAVMLALLFNFYRIRWRPRGPERHLARSMLMTVGL
jgi:hypothetical protein